MPFNITITISAAGGFDTPLEGSIPLTPTGVLGINDVEIPEEAVAQPVDLAFDLERLEGILMLSDVDMTVETNDTGSPAQDTILLKAGKPFLYVPNTGTPSPFAGDVTGLFVTHAGLAVAHLEVRVYGDFTPAA